MLIHHRGLMSGRRPAAGGPVKTYLDSYADGDNLSTYLPLSAWTVSPSDTYFIFGFCFEASSARSVTYAGVNHDFDSPEATAIAVPGGTHTLFAGLYAVPLSGNTYVQPFVELSGAAINGVLFGWSGSGIDLTPSATDTADTSSPYSATITIPAGGLGFAVVYDAANGSPTISWTNYTEDGEATVEFSTAGAASFSGADSTGPTATYSSGSGGRMAVATFGPEA